LSWQGTPTAPVCDGKCILGGLVEEVNRRVRDHLAKTRLSEFAKPVVSKKRQKLARSRASKRRR